MLIRYHLIYYALGCLLAVCGYYVHWVFFLLLIGYLFWLYHRFQIRYIGVMLCITCLLFCIPRSYHYEFNEVIEGHVTKVGDQYCYLKTNNGTVKLYHEEDIRYQDRIECSVEYLDIDENRNDYAFHEKNYLYSVHVIAKAKLKNIHSIDHQYGFYHWLEKRFSKDEKLQNYQRLFVFGEKSEGIQEDYQFLSQISIVHLFALSGMYIHVLFSFLKSCLGLFMTQKYSKYLSYGILAFYIFSIPMSISLYRAFFVLILYDLLKKWLNRLDVFALLIIISLLYNPYLIFNVSFVFSYFVYFIVLITSHMKFKDVLIYLSTIPIVLQLNSQISIVSFLLGICMTPFIELFYMMSLGSLFLPFFQYGLKICIVCLEMVLSFVKVIDGFFAFSYPSLSFVVMYYILFFSIIYAMQLKRCIKKHIFALLALMIVFRIYGEYKIYGEITMIDVGQGDCTLIRLPMNQGNILIDTGGSKDYDIATKTIIPYLKAVGIHQLDYVYISHDDYDHSGALTSLKDNFQVKNVIRDFEEYREIGDIKITMLEHSYTSDSNDQSLVMKVDFPTFSILFTGDISSHVEEEIYQKYKQLDVDILKVSHHGSHTATSPILFQMIQPDVAMIGVKKNNLYHHPSQEVISRLQRKQIKILRTDQDGMFHIRYYLNSNYFILR